MPGSVRIGIIMIPFSRPYYTSNARSPPIQALPHE